MIRVRLLLIHHSSLIISLAESGGALEVCDDEAEHSVGYVAGERFAKGLQTAGAETRGRVLYLGAVLRRDELRHVEGAAFEYARGEVALDRYLGQPALRANLFDREPLLVERVGLVNRARLRLCGRARRLRRRVARRGVRGVRSVVA